MGNHEWDPKFHSRILFEEKSKPTIKILSVVFRFQPILLQQLNFVFERTQVQRHSST